MQDTLDLPPLPIEEPIAFGSQEYPLIQEKYFKEHPGEMALFRELVHLVPQAVGQVGQIIDVPKDSLMDVLNRLYHIGLQELITICSDPIIDDPKSLETYVEERLASILLAEIDMLEVFV